MTPIQPITSLPSLAPVSPFDPSPIVIGLLGGLLLLCLGLLAGYYLGTYYRRAIYRQNLRELQEDVSAWRNAYDEAIRKVRAASVTASVTAFVPRPHPPLRHGLRAVHRQPAAR